MLAVKFKKLLIIFIGFLVFGAALSLILHIYPDWDFFSYHYYNGWAFFNNRLNTDFLPAFHRTYFNPVVDALNYQVLKFLNNYPYVFLFINGFKIGLFLFFTYLISDYIFNERTCKYNCTILNSAVIALTILSPLLINASSFDYIHIQISVLIVASFYFFIKNIYKNKTKKEFLFLFLSSFLLGIALGLRYTTIGFGIAFCVCLFCFKKKIPSFYKTLIIVFLGALIGFLISDGWWLWIVYKNFHNPFFPYFNNIFHSHMNDSSSVLAMDYEHLRPTNLLEFVFYPLLDTRIFGRIGEESSFFDLKIPLIFIVICTYFLINKLNLLDLEIKNKDNHDVMNIIFVFISITFYTNLILFSKYGYIIGLIPMCSIALIFFLQELYTNHDKTKNFVKGFSILSFSIIIFYITTNLNKIIFTKFKICFIAFILLAIFLIIKNNKWNNIEKQMYVTISILLIFLIILFYPNKWKKGSDNFNYNIIDIKNANIEDNATVLCGSLATSFIIPAQNPKANYIIYVPPKKFLPPKPNIISNRYFPNKYPYHSSFSENKIKQLFKNSKNLYFIFSDKEFQDNIEYQHSYKDKKELFDSYRMQFKYYSNGEINSFNKCRNIKVYIMGKRYKKMVLCKLK